MLWFFLLGILCTIMALSALIGVATLVLGLLSLGVNLEGVLKMHLCGAEVHTAAQKLLFAALGAAMTLLGVGFLWLYRRGSIGLALLVFVAFLGLFAAIGWLSGSADILSAGG